LSAAPTLDVSAFMRSPTLCESDERRAMPFAISSIVALTASIAAALSWPRDVMSATDAAISAALARSSSLAAARSSAFAPTAFTERDISSSVVAVLSAVSASWVLTFRDSVKEAAIVVSDWAFASIERVRCVAASAVSRCWRATC
jgi:hypothetical protein